MAVLLLGLNILDCPPLGIHRHQTALRLRSEEGREDFDEVADMCVIVCLPGNVTSEAASASAPSAYETSFKFLGPMLEARIVSRSSFYTRTAGNSH